MYFLFVNEFVLGEFAEFLGVHAFHSFGKAGGALGQVGVRASPEGDVGHAVFEGGLNNFEGFVTTLLIDFFLAGEAVRLGPAAVAVGDDCEVVECG